MFRIKFLFLLFIIPSIIMGNDPYAYLKKPFDSLYNFLGHIILRPFVCKEMITGNWAVCVEGAKEISQVRQDTLANLISLWQTGKEISTSQEEIAHLIEIIEQNKILCCMALIGTAFGVYNTYQLIKNKQESIASDQAVLNQDGFSYKQKIKNYSKITIAVALTLVGLSSTIGCYGMHQYLTALMPR